MNNPERFDKIETSLHGVQFPLRPPTKFSSSWTDGQCKLCNRADGCTPVSPEWESSAISALIQVEKLAAVFFRRDRARVVLPEGAVPIPCDQVVAPSSQRQGKHAQRSAQSSPTSAQFPQHRNGGVGPRRDPLFPQAAIDYHVHGVEVFGRCAMASQELGSKITLQGGETEAVLRIMLQHELNQPVAETADAIIENNRIGAGDGHAAP